MRSSFSRSAQQAQDSGFLLEAHMALGVSYYTLGEFSLARKHSEQGIPSMTRSTIAPMRCATGMIRG